MSHQESIARRQERAAVIHALIISVMAGILSGFFAGVVSESTGVALMVGLSVMVLILKVCRWGWDE